MATKTKAPTFLPPVVIDPNAVFTKLTATEALGFRPETLARYMRRGELRYAKRGGRCFFLGAWLLEFLAAGEIRRSNRQES